MIPKNQVKILNLLLRSTNKYGHNINQIAKTLKISTGSSFKILKELEKKSFVISEKINNSKNYYLNFENKQARKLCEFILLEELNHLSRHAKLYTENIQEFKKAKLIILFGSILEKKEYKDVDALFVTTNIKEVQSFCFELSKIRTKPVIPLILSEQDLIKEIKSKNPAVSSLINNGFILKGESVFVDLMKNVRA